RLEIGRTRSGREAKRRHLPSCFLLLQQRLLLFGAVQLPAPQRCRHGDRHREQHQRRPGLAPTGPGHLEAGCRQNCLRHRPPPAIMAGRRRNTMRFVVAIAFIGILYSLGSAVVFLMKDTGNSKRMAYALTARISLSVLLFLFVLFAHWMGWIQATGFN